MRILSWVFVWTISSPIVRCSRASTWQVLSMELEQGMRACPFESPTGNLSLLSMYLDLGTDLVSTGKNSLRKPFQRYICPTSWTSSYPFRLSLSFCFIEGVLVAKKDFNAPKHEELDVQVPNNQSTAKFDFKWMCEDPIFVAMVLLCTHPRGRWVPSRMVWA